MIKLLQNKNYIKILSIIWAIGLATIFRKICNDRTCITYRAPDPNYITSNIWKFNDKCYKFITKNISCEKNVISS
tara:strand:- start:33 stop:257 length:225 start_codon:yes stop_codon:yes gene_type:complete